MHNYLNPLITYNCLHIVLGSSGLAILMLLWGGTLDSLLRSLFQTLLDISLPQFQFPPVIPFLILFSSQHVLFSKIVLFISWLIICTLWLKYKLQEKRDFVLSTAVAQVLVYIKHQLPDFHGKVVRNCKNLSLDKITLLASSVHYDMIFFFFFPVSLMIYYDFALYFPT